MKRNTGLKLRSNCILTRAAAVFAALLLILLSVTVTPQTVKAEGQQGDRTLTIHRGLTDTDNVTIQGLASAGDTVVFSGASCLQVLWQAGGESDELNTGAWYVDKGVHNVKPGYVLTGWSTEPNGTGEVYTLEDGSFVMPDQDVDLYPVWTEAHKVTIHTNYGAEGDLDIVTYVKDGWNLNVYYVQQLETVFIIANTEKDESTYLMYGGYNEADSLDTSGKEFASWNTASDGTGTDLDASFYVYSDMDIYGRWEQSYTVTLYDNSEGQWVSGTGSKITPSYFGVTGPAFGESSDPDKTAYTVMYSFAKEGCIVESWNTEADGSGTRYELHETYPVTSDLTLYAQWIPVYSVTVHGIGEDQAAVTGCTVVELFRDELNGDNDRAYFDFENEGYALSGWNTAQDGTGTSYGLNQKVVLTSDLELYAEWTELKTVTFHSNVPGEEDLTETMTGYDTVVIFFDGAYCIGDYVDFDFTNGTKTIASWNTSPDGTGMAYEPGKSYAFITDLDLYAQWDDTFEITLVEPESQQTLTLRGYDYIEINCGINSCYVGTGAEEIRTRFKKEGYMITSWNTAADGSGTAYTNNSSTPLTGDLTLYAQWTRKNLLTVHCKNEELKDPEITLLEGGYVFFDTQNGFAATYFPGEPENYLTGLSYRVPTGEKVLSGWNTKEDGTGTFYALNTLIGPVSGDLELWPVLSDDAVTVTIVPGFSNAEFTGYAYGSGESGAVQSVDVRVLRGSPVGWADFDCRTARTDIEIVGYTKDLSKKTFYDELQIYNGELIADSDMTIYAVYSDLYQEAYDEASGFYYSVLNNGTVRLTGYDGKLEEAEVPLTVDGKTVSYVFEEAFQQKNGYGLVRIRSLIYPEEIAHFGGISIFSFVYLESIRFTGNAPRLKYGSELYDLDITAYYPNTWTEVPSSTFGEARNITWVAYDPDDMQEADIDVITELTDDAPAITAKVSDRLIEYVAERMPAEMRADFEAGEPLSVIIRADELETSEIPAADKDILNLILSESGETLGAAYNISLFFNVSGSSLQVHETSDATEGGKVYFMLEVPEALRTAPEGMVRFFSLWRIHDGQKTLIASSSKTTLEGSSDRFSTYILTYQDVPATGDAEKPVLWAVCALTTAVLAALVLKKRSVR